MLSTNSILSLDQGKLFLKPKNEDDYYARYVTAADKAKPAVQQNLRTGSFLGFAWVGAVWLANLL